MDIGALIEELRRDPVGYLVVAPLTLAMILSRGDVELLNELKVSECIIFGESADPAMVQAVRDHGISVRSSYSSEEVGQIAFECASCAGRYHVTTSNVIVEVVDVSHDVGGTKLGRVLVTHLHSYATPFIRYDLGDLALLKDRCACGHNGPTLHALHGRATSALKHRDGSLHPFFIRGHELLKVVEFREFRILAGYSELIPIRFRMPSKASQEKYRNVNVEQTLAEISERDAATSQMMKDVLYGIIAQKNTITSRV